MPNELSIIVDAVLNPASLLEIQNEIAKLSKGTKIDITADTSKAKKEVEDLKQKIINGKGQAKITVDVDKSKSKANIDTYVNSIKNKFERSPIKVVLGVDGAKTLSNFQSAIASIQKQLGKNPVQVQVAPVVPGNKGNAGQNGNNAPVVAPPSFGGDKPSGAGADLQKYYDQLNSAVAKFQTTAFSDTNAKVSSFRIIHDEINDAYSAAVEFNNALGETTQVMFKLQAIVDDSGNKTGDKWIASGEKFSATFKDTGKDIEKTLDTLQGFQSSLNEIQSKAFDRTNKLTGNFAQPVSDEIKNIQDTITALTDNARNNGITITAQQVRDLKTELKDLNNLRIKQQNTQFQARQLSATDITQQIPILKNDITTLENKLKSMGFGSKFESQINDLRDLLKTLGQPGGATVQQYNSQMKQLKSDVTRYQGTVRGRADVASTGITNNQLQSIQGINKVLNAQANTEGIQKARQELSALADEYKKLQTQLQSGKLSNARLGVIDRETKELDQQLRTYQNLAKNLNGDTSSQQWVANQETGIQRMKASFVEYQQEVSKTIQLTPELQTQMNAVAETMNRPGAIDVANWREAQAVFDQLKISVDQFKNSVQGQASALSINIETNKLQEVTSLIDKLNNTTVQSSGIASVKTELESLSTQYQEVVTQLQNPNLGEEEFKKLSDTVDELDKRFTTLSNRTDDSFLKKYQLDADNLSMRFEKLKQKYDDFLKTKPSGGNAELEASFERVQTALNNITPDNIQEVQKEMRNLATETSKVVGPTQTLSQALRESLGGVGGYLARFVSGAAIIQKTISVVKQMVTEIKALDTSLVELQKVTGLTGDALSQFTDKAYQVGSSLGRTGQDVIDAVTTFSRAGYELKEATDLAQAALVMTNIGPDITSTEAAASDMISIFKAYKIEAEDAMGVIDRLYNVANKEPLDFGNITQMLVTAGGTLAQTGTTLDQTMGLLTSAFATMRDESVANG